MNSNDAYLISKKFNEKRDINKNEALINFHTKAYIRAMERKIKEATKKGEFLAVMKLSIYNFGILDGLLSSFRISPSMYVDNEIMKRVTEYFMTQGFTIESHSIESHSSPFFIVVSWEVVN